VRKSGQLQLVRMPYFCSIGPVVSEGGAVLHTCGNKIYSDGFTALSNVFAFVSAGDKLVESRAKGKRNVAT